jgi:subtilisin family serine protease
MPQNLRRRSVLKAIGALGTTMAVGSQSVSASVAEDRWICDMEADGMTMDALSAHDDVSVVADLREEIGYCTVTGPESALPAEPPVDYDRVSFDLERDAEEFSQEDLQTLIEAHENGGLPYAPDIVIELDEPQVEQESGLNARDTVDDTLYDLQWDKQSQRIGQVHDQATGEGARIGVIDDGVLGANPDSDAAHPDLPNVLEDRSVDFTFDGNGPGALNDDHGTHVAGTAAAAANGEGVVGVAPDAEVVDLRVFSGAGAATSAIVNAIVVGSAPEDEEFLITDGSLFDPETKTVSGADCDVVNLSLGLPTQPVCSFFGLLILLFFYPLYESAAETALENDCLPVASAGNDATNLADPTAGGFCDPPIEFFGESGFFTLPASVDQYLTVGATGPVGFGWGTSPGRGGGRGKGSSRTEEVAPGLEIESTLQTELFPEEPSFYTNYGGDGEVNVTAGGGNLDLDAEGEADQGQYFYDLLFNTGFVTTDDPEDTRLETYEPSYVWKAGTSFSAPQVSGLAALLAGADPDASPGEIRSVIESTATQPPVGKSGQTTAPETFPDVLGQSDGVGVQDDGQVNGDTPSNPGSNESTLSSEAVRGSGHIDIKAAVDAILD